MHRRVVAGGGRLVRMHPFVERHSKSGMWRYQRKVPADNAAIQWETREGWKPVWNIVQTLGTRDAPEANKRAPEIHARVEADFAAARRGEWPPISDDQVRTTVRDWWGWVREQYPEWNPSDFESKCPISDA